MAKTTVTRITDDLDGSTDAVEVSFAYEGTEYTIDLGEENKAALEEALKPYLQAATKVARRSGMQRSTSSTRRDLAKIRAWAADQGLAVSERGRVAKSVIEAYEAAH